MAALAHVDTRREFEHLAGIHVPVAIAVAAIVFGAILFVLGTGYRSGCLTGAR